jgi:hypothetical protein
VPLRLGLPSSTAAAVLRVVRVCAAPVAHGARCTRAGRSSGASAGRVSGPREGGADCFISRRFDSGVSARSTRPCGLVRVADRRPVSHSERGRSARKPSPGTRPPTIGAEAAAIACLVALSERSVGGLLAAEQRWSRATREWLDELARIPHQRGGISPLATARRDAHAARGLAGAVGLGARAGGSAKGSGRGLRRVAAPRSGPRRAPLRSSPREKSWLSTWSSSSSESHHMRAVGRTALDRCARGPSYATSHTIARSSCTCRLRRAPISSSVTHQALRHELRASQGTLTNHARRLASLVATPPGGTLDARRERRRSLRDLGDEVRRSFFSDTTWAAALRVAPTDHRRHRGVRLRPDGCVARGESWLGVEVALSTSHSLEPRATQRAATVRRISVVDALGSVPGGSPMAARSRDRIRAASPRLNG